jgi:hypothetical protein
MDSHRETGDRERETGRKAGSLQANRQVKQRVANRQTKPCKLDRDVADKQTAESASRKYTPLLENGFAIIPWLALPPFPNLGNDFFGILQS